jgi:hypothetical protein
MWCVFKAFPTYIEILTYTNPVKCLPFYKDCDFYKQHQKDNFQCLVLLCTLKISSQSHKSMIICFSCVFILEEGKKYYARWKIHWKKYVLRPWRVWAVFCEHKIGGATFFFFFYFHRIHQAQFNPSHSLDADRLSFSVLSCDSIPIATSLYRDNPASPLETSSCHFNSLRHSFWKSTGKIPLKKLSLSYPQMYTLVWALKLDLVIKLSMPHGSQFFSQKYYNS